MDVTRQELTQILTTDPLAAKRTIERIKLHTTTLVPSTVYGPSISSVRRRKTAVKASGDKLEHRGDN